MHVRRALTLIELMVVVTLAAIGVSTVAMQVHGAGERARVHGAASQIEAIYRLALADANRSGLPRRLALSATTCGILKPQRIAEEWKWTRSATFDLVRNTELRDVILKGRAIPRSGRESTWLIALPPGGLPERVTFDLAGRSYAIRLTIEGASSRWVAVSTE